MSSNKKILCIHRGGYIFDAIVPVLSEVCAERNWTFREEARTSALPVGTVVCPLPESLYREFDLIFLGRNGHNKFIWPQTPGIDKYAHKVIALDGAAGPARRVPHKCAYYFKREYVGNGWQKQIGAIPISLCAPRGVVAMDPLPWEQRDIDVFIAVCLKSGGIRGGLVLAVQFDCITNDRKFVAYGFPGKGKALSKAKYLDLLRRSKIAIAPRGSGEDTNTYWEIPACGVAMLAQRRTITILNNFVEGEEALFFDTAKEMVDLYVSALKDPDRLREMAFAGRAKVLAHHTAEKQVEMLLEVARPILEGE